MVYFPASFELFLVTALTCIKLVPYIILKVHFLEQMNYYYFTKCAHWHGYYGPVTHPLFTCMYLNF